MPAREPLLTRQAVAEILCCHRRTVDVYIRSGDLAAYRISPRLVRIEPASVREFLARRRIGGKA